MRGKGHKIARPTSTPDEKNTEKGIGGEERKKEKEWRNRDEEEKEGMAIGNLR